MRFREGKATPEAQSGASSGRAALNSAWLAARTTWTGPEGCNPKRDSNLFRVASARTDTPLASAASPGW